MKDFFLRVVRQGSTVALGALFLGNTLLVAAQQKQAVRIGDFKESISLNEHLRGTSRTLQYRPEGKEFVCINGKNRYTRALYGTHSPFRVETSDRPVFAFYNNGRGGNISFSIMLRSGEVVALDSTAYCEARYVPGKRLYWLKDPAWRGGELRIVVLALADADGAVWRISASSMPRGTKLRWKHGGATGKRLSRNGDMGVDPADCFELPADAEDVEQGELPLKKDTYWVRGNVPPQYDARIGFRLAEEAASTLEERLLIDTPDPYLNPVGGALVAAADGIWDGEVWLHGAIGWRMPLNGWRAGYTGDALGWHDRARKHFNAYAASQVTEIPQTIPHPAQDTLLNLARSEKRWGTPQYSNGYICRNPNRNNQMHHYDMNLCYIDALLWHFNWTGDVAYVRRMWPTLVRHLAWEKRNYDPDDDGLYDAYACIWASDALYYNSGGVTHSSAYNYRSNQMAARLATLIDEDPEPYLREAEKILHAMNARLWMPEKGCWAEYQDFMGHRRLHESPGVWTIYHALDSEVADPFQAYQATRYIDTQIPHIPLVAPGLEEGYATLSTTNWLPYSWSVNNVAFAEVMHTALAYFQAGRQEEAYRLMKSSFLDGMYLGSSPGNFGQISFYDAARGECYRDFGDPVGVASRLLVQGLYGILPDALNGRLHIRPGFPAAWEHASISLPGISYRFSRSGSTDTYQVEQCFSQALDLLLQLPVRRDSIRSIRVNGTAVMWTFEETASGYPLLSVPGSSTRESIIEIEWGGDTLLPVQPVVPMKCADWLELSVPTGVRFGKIYDPQQILTATEATPTALRCRMGNSLGHHTFFVRVHQGEMKWWHPVNVEVETPNFSAPTSDFTEIRAHNCRLVDMDTVFNANVTDIFQNKYLSPRSPYTTLQLPVQGIGEWCHPKLTADIDDAGLRSQVKGGVFTTSLGISFRTPAEGKNIAYTSLWNNYPDSLSVPLSGQASHAYLMLAGSTNHMQCHIANGVVRVYYTDGSAEVLQLVNPTNWCPIEQDFFIDGLAFRVPEPHPYRIHFRSGLVSRDLGKVLGITGVYGRAINGGAGVLLDLPLNPAKELDRLVVETLSNDVVIGLMAITLQ